MSFLSLRNRLLQTLILGLIGLTFYTYYKTTDSEIQQYALLRSYNRSGSYEPTVLHVHPAANASSADVASTPLTKIPGGSSSEGLTLVSASHNASGVSSNLSSPITVVSSGSQTSLSSGPSKPSAPGSSSTSSSTTSTTSTTAAPSAAPTIDKNSARAIYVPGHIDTSADKCPDFGKFMDLVIVVMSSPTHVEARTAIRQTWGHYGQRRDIGIVFMLGSTTDPKIEAKLDREQNIYGDMVRGRFLDSYTNLTLKTISILEWVDTYCSEVSFVLKTDDDMFINIPRLVAFINKHRKEHKVIYGKLARKWKPVRNKASKYFIPAKQYKPPFYPDFCTGPAYLISTDIVHDLYERALNETFLKLEDVFLTGIVASKLGVRRVHAYEFLNRKISYNPCNVQRGISIHMVKYSEQFDLWKKLLDGKSKCK